MFTQLFGRLLALVYHCFDRIVILGHLPLLTRPENLVHFFRDVHGIRAITKDVLRTRTHDYNGWVESFARNHHLPIEWAEDQFRSLGRPDARDCAFDLLAAYEGSALLANTMRDPEVLTGAARRIDRWIDTLR